MNIETLKKRMEGLPAGMMFSSGEIVRQLEKISDYRFEISERKKSVKAPSGPGKAGFPCPCGEGQLLMKTCVGVEKATGKYVRYRQCNACGVRVKTREVVEDVLPESDARTGEWRKGSKAGKQRSKRLEVVA